MHELSLAGAIADVATRHARGRRVTRIEVTVGHLRQVVPSALLFAFELVAKGTVLEGAELALTEAPARGRCRACGAESALPGFPFACGACDGLDLEITGGEQLEVVALEIDEPEGGDARRAATGAPAVSAIR